MKRMKKFKPFKPMRPMKPMAPMRALDPLDQLVQILTEDGGSMSAACTLFSTSPTRCPLCRIDVPANTRHTCSRRQS